MKTGLKAAGWRISTGALLCVAVVGGGLIWQKSHPALLDLRQGSAVAVPTAAVSAATPPPAMAPSVPQPTNAAPAPVEGSTQTERACGAPYPCQLVEIIDRNDWAAVQSALAFATQMNVASKVQWKGTKNNHHGYIVKSRNDADCKIFNVYSVMGSDKESRSVTTCRNAQGDIEIR